VARTLEQRWDAALAAIEALEAEYGLLQRTALAREKCRARWHT